LRSESSKTLFLLASAGAFAALAWSAQQGGPRVVTAAPPPLRAVDEAPPRTLRIQLALELGLPVPGHTFAWGTDVFCTRSPCTSAAIAKVKAELEARQDAIRPAPGSPPRIVAELRGRALLLAWRDRANLLCLRATRLPQGGGSIFGPCVQSDVPCADICLRSDGEGVSRASIEYLLAGTVRRDATALRITRSREAATQYPLRGPIVRGTDRRVFMLDLGRHDWRRLELFRGDAVVAVQAMPEWQAAAEDCQERYTTDSQLNACTKRAAPVIPRVSFP
jgi:hypothetical protein